MIWKPSQNWISMRVKIYAGSYCADPRAACGPLSQLIPTEWKMHSPGWKHFIRAYMVRYKMYISPAKWMHIMLTWILSLLAHNLRYAKANTGFVSGYQA